MGMPPIDWIAGQDWERAVRELGSTDVNQQLNAVQKWEQYADDRLTGQKPGRSLYHVLQSARMSLAIRRGGIIAPSEPVDDCASYAVCEYLRAGRQSFVMSEGLGGELTMTDVDDVGYDELALPYEAFYLDLVGLAAASRGVGVAGAIVQRFKYVDADLITIALTPFVVDNGGARPLMTIRMRSEPGDTVPQALRRTVDHEIDNAHKINMVVQCAPGMSAKLRDAKDDPEEKAAKAAHVDGVVESAAVIEDILPLLANALLYIDQCKGAGRKTWPADAPTDLAEKAESTAPGARKAAQKLTAMGFTRITRLELEDGDELHTKSERTMPRAHWRRGHWRRQRHGPGATLVKRIRIRPVMVGIGGDQRETRRYAVQAANTRATLVPADPSTQTGQQA